MSLQTAFRFGDHTGEAVVCQVIKPMPARLAISSETAARLLFAGSLGVACNGAAIAETMRGRWTGMGQGLGLRAGDAVTETERGESNAKKRFHDGFSIWEPIFTNREMVSRRFSGFYFPRGSILLMHRRGEISFDDLAAIDGDRRTFRQAHLKKLISTTASLRHVDQDESL